MQKVSPVPRIEWIDFAKGFMMIAIVWGHVVISEIDANKFFAAFRMPFFFVMAGFLLNLNKWSGAENFRPFMTKLFWRLLVPYYLAEILWYPIWFVVCHEKNFLQYLWGWTEIAPMSAVLVIFGGNGAEFELILGQLWFLPVLFFAEIIFVRLYNRFAKFGGEIFALIIVAVSYLGCLIGQKFFLPLGSDIALAAQIFLLTGILLRRYGVVDRTDWKIFFVLTIILACSFLFNERVDMHPRRYGNELLFYMGGIVGSLLVMKLSVLMTKVGGKICTLIKDCGRQSIMILILHPIIANIFYEVIVRVANFPPEKIFTEPTIIFFTTILGTLIPLFVAKRFGKLPVLKNFCA